jgi:hypothetical protein
VIYLYKYRVTLDKAHDGPHSHAFFSNFLFLFYSSFISISITQLQYKAAPGKPNRQATHKNIVKPVQPHK